MALDVQRSVAAAKARLGTFSSAQLVIIGLLAVVGLIAAGAFVRWVSAPSYEVLLAGLDATDAAAVTEQLDASGVKYQIAAGGGTILVPSSQVQAQRLAVAAAGLPQGTTQGYELLDEQGMTSSSFQQKIAYQRAVQGELSRTLMQMREVRSATVNLALPEEALFTEDDAPAQASVLLETTGTLAPESVDAVQRLVSSAVPDLEPGAVTVSDTKGRLLSSPDGGGGSGRLEAEQAYEDAAAARADTMLASVLGPDRAVVRVNAEMDPAERSRESESYDPERSALLRRQSATEDYDAAGVMPGGVVAVPDPVDPNAAEAGRSTYTKDDESEEFGVSREVERESVAPGALRRLSVAVMVDQTAAGLPPDAVISELVANAVGVDEARGDTISVAATPFRRIDAPTEAMPGGTDWGRHAGTGVAVILLLMVGFAFLRAVRRGTVHEIDLVGYDEEPEALPAAPPTVALPVAPSNEAAAYDAKILELVDQRPDEVSALIRSWMAEPAESGKK